MLLLCRGVMEKIYLYRKICPAVFKRITAVSFFILLITIHPYCQTTDISGVVNTYHKVVEIIPAKACVRVSDITDLNVNSRVMLVQMKGASIITSNTAAFGDTISLNQAGNYEIGAVCYIIGDSVFLFHNLLNTYNTASGKVQLVQFGEYSSANVVDTVKAASWDSARGTGGVIAIFADQDITLNAPIYADSSGYRGGPFFLSDGTCSNFLPASGYAYDGTPIPPPTPSTQNGARKGEGVSFITSVLSGGRGAPANGGGGGNNHNNSGGGGANLNMGGNGGGNSSNTGCRVAIQGLAGKALSSHSGTKIFLGGGGGAGHSNNGSSTYNYGGNGGGIIFIWATNLIGNGKSISVKGGKGGDSQGDGTGGGGAGGTLILHISNYSGSVFITSNGGNGGDSYNDISTPRCYGGGGGGSGGVIYFTGSIPGGATTSTTGGARGLEPDRNGSCLAPVPGAPGSNGQTFSSYTFSRSTSTAGYCRFLLPVKLVSFTASVIDKKVLLKWHIDNPESVNRFIIERSVNGNEWMKLKTIGSNNQENNYLTVDEKPIPGRTYYRIKFIEKNNTLSYSTARQVTTGNYNEFIIYPNPAGNKITVAGNYNCPANLKLMDVSGKIIFHRNILNRPATIDLPYLTPGIYILQVNQAVQKLIIH